MGEKRKKKANEPTGTILIPSDRKKGKEAEGVEGDEVGKGGLCKYWATNHQSTPCTCPSGKRQENLCESKFHLKV